MTEALHDGGFAAGNAVRNAKRFVRCAGIVVFAGQQKQRAAARVDLGNATPDVAVELVEIQIAFEDARAALHVMPQRLPSLVVRRIGPNQSGNDGGADFATGDVGTVQEIQIVIGADVRTDLKADYGAELFRMLECQM